MSPDDGVSTLEGRHGLLERRRRRAPDGPDAGQDRARTGDGLQAAAASALARQPVSDDDHVADLTGTGTVPLKQRAVEHETRPDPPADLDGHQVRSAHGPEGVLGEGGHLAVVYHVHGQAPARADEIAQGHPAPLDVHRLHDRAVGRVDEAGGPDADPEHRTGGGGQQPVEQLEYALQRAVSVAVPGRHLGHPDHFAVEIDDRATEHALPEVDAHHVAGASWHFEEDRGFAPAGRTAPDLANEARLEQGRDDVRDRGAGQPGEARDMRPAGGAHLVEGREDEALVVGARVSQGSLRRSLYHLRPIVQSLDNEPSPCVKGRRCPVVFQGLADHKMGGERRGVR